MSSVLRQMTEPDLRGIAQLEARAFAEYYRRSGRATRPVERTPEHLTACLISNRTGCFVAVENTVVGFVFSRTWGAVGWIGTIAVEPESQRRAIGASLLSAATGALVAKGCTVIGLETMADSPENVGFYLRHGFRLRQPTLMLRKTLTDIEPTSLVCHIANPGLESLSAVARISAAAWLPLDYSSEAANAWAYRWGQILLWQTSDPWGLAIIRTAPKRAGGDNDVCHVAVLALSATGRQYLRVVLRDLETFASANGFARLSLCVNATDAATVQELIGRGFRVGRATLRMALSEDDSVQAGVDASEWGM
jgi:ribosomal protein S18 acetylase RimI-like enzyme